MSANETAKLTIGEKTYEFPVITGNEGEKAIDISKLRSQTGLITLDNGYANTGACLSSITFLDGEQGILKYRGIPIEVLAEKSRFLDVAYLLYYGHLPNTQEIDDFRFRITRFEDLPEGLRSMIKMFPTNSHPMGVLASAVAALSNFYPEYLQPNLSKEQKDMVFVQMLSQMRAICTYFYRHTIGKNPVRAARPSTYTTNFLNMMFNAGKPVEDSVHPEVAKALDVLFILHADHEQNCSTSTVRMVGSADANIYATISAGIDALWGPLHGGANQAVIEMLEAIHRDGGGHKKFLEKAKDKNDSFKLMGFGHRVYKNFDPRARIIKTACDTVLNRLGINDPLLEIAKGLEEAALKDPYFVERKLYPNVDFYSGIIYRAIGIPTNMFTVMFAMGRLPGWLSQWKEMTEDDKTKICRPRQIYVGAKDTVFKDLADR